MSGSLTGGTTLLALHQAFALVATSVLQVVAARYLGPEVYGVFSVVQAILAVLLFTALTGVPHAVAAVAAADSAHTRGIVRTGLGLQTAIGVGLGAALYLLADPLAVRLGDPLHADLLRWAAIALPLTGIPYVWIFALNGLHRFGRQSASLILLTGTKALAVILVLVLGGGVIGAMQGVVVAAAVAAVGVAMLARGLPGGKAFPARHLAGQSMQLGATYVAVAVWDQSDLVLIGALGSRAGDVGLFAAATAVAAAPGALFAPLANALFPATARAAAEGKLDVLRRSVGSGVDLVYRALLPVTGFGIVAGPALAVLLFGDEYRDAGPALAALLAGTLAYALYEILDTVLRSGGRARLSWQIATAALVAHVALSAVLIPRFGLGGAAVTRLLSSAVAFVAVAVPVARWLGLRAGMIAVARPALATALAFAPAWFGPRDGIAGLALAAAGFVLYGGLMWLLRGIHADDVWRAREVLATLASLGKGGTREGGVR